MVPPPPATFESVTQRLQNVDKKKIEKVSKLEEDFSELRQDRIDARAGAANAVILKAKETLYEIATDVKVVETSGQGALHRQFLFYEAKLDEKNKAVRDWHRNQSAKIQEFYQNADQEKKEYGRHQKNLIASFQNVKDPLDALVSAPNSSDLPRMMDAKTMHDPISVKIPELRSAEADMKRSIKKWKSAFNAAMVRSHYEATQASIDIAMDFHAAYARNNRDGIREGPVLRH